jgi:hypothetical protein
MEGTSFSSFLSKVFFTVLGHRSQITEGPVLRSFLFLCKAELGFFHVLEIVTGWPVPSTDQKIPVQPGWYLPPQKIPLVENRFLQAGKGAENTKEIIQAVLYCTRSIYLSIYLWTFLSKIFGAWKPAAHGRI